MTMITATGRELAKPILRHLHATYGSDVALGVERICSLIARSGPTYKRLQEAACNTPMDEDDLKRHQNAEARCEQAVSRHCAELTKITHLPITPEFEGDPRGFTMRLKWSPGDSYDVGVPGS